MARFKFTNLRHGELQPLLSALGHARPLVVEIFANEASATKPFFTATFSPTRIPCLHVILLYLAHKSRHQSAIITAAIASGSNSRRMWDTRVEVKYCQAVELEKLHDVVRH
jgi:hypothetical protein